ALRLLRASLPTTIEMRQNIASDSLVVGDPTQIQQVLMNLCTNAGYAMQEKGGIMEVSLVDINIEDEDLSRQPKMIADSYVRLTVSDTGHGMTPDVLERIFDPFFTTKERSKGTGMGLSVVHGIVESHNGTISVSSEPDKGTTFNVYFPLFSDETEITTNTMQPLPAGNERILFVDDEMSIVETGKHVLETLGYDVTTLTNSSEALELFRGEPDKFDLVITDMTMPNMTGDKLAKEMLHIRPDIPIIMCTGYSALINKEQAEAIGIRAYIMKPILKSEIAHAIRTVLSPSELR
ncbi:MAG: response regulator, partial [Deltaproteobacteria bacterium]|nr:response regulator [Deltaproteobacteria bacterium]